MNDKLIMALDIGTSFVKAGVYNLKGERAGVFKEPVKSESPQKGMFIQWGDDLYEAAFRCMKSVCKILGDAALAIEAISFTGQMAGFMAIGEEGQDVTGWSCGADMRYSKYADSQIQQYKKDFISISGTSSPVFSGKYNWFSEEFPDQTLNIRKFIMINSYILNRLSGSGPENAVIDTTLLCWTGFSDIKNVCWSEELTEKLEIDKAFLPRIVESHERVAMLSEDNARKLGMKPVPLIAGAGDKISGCVGAGILEPGDAIFEAGSFGGLSCCVGDFRPDMEKEGYDCLRGCGKNDMYAHFYIPGSGLTLDWFVENFVKKEDTGLTEGFNEINKKIRDIEPGCRGLMGIGMLSGKVMPFNGELRGMWLGFDYSHKPEHFFKALIESHGYAIAGALDRICEKYPEYKFDKIVTIGGGAKSPEQTQIFADICGREFVTVDRDDLALWGACLLGARGIGLMDDIKAYAKKYTKIKNVFKPDMEKHGKYEILRKKYAEYEKDMTYYCSRLREDSRD